MTAVAGRLRPVAGRERLDVGPLTHAGGVQLQRLLDRVDRRELACGAHRQVDVRTERERDPPPADRAVRVLARRLPEGADGGVVVEAEGQREALIEELLRGLRVGRDRVVEIADVREQADLGIVRDPSLARRLPETRFPRLPGRAAAPLHAVDPGLVGLTAFVLLDLVLRDQDLAHGGQLVGVGHAGSLELVDPAFDAQANARILLDVLHPAPLGLLLGASDHRGRDVRVAAVAGDPGVDRVRIAWPRLELDRVHVGQKGPVSLLILHLASQCTAGNRPDRTTGQREQHGDGAHHHASVDPLESAHPVSPSGSGAVASGLRVRDQLPARRSSALPIE